MSVLARLVDYFLQVKFPARHHSRPWALVYLRLHNRYSLMPDTRCELVLRLTPPGLFYARKRRDLRGSLPTKSSQLGVLRQNDRP